MNPNKITQIVNVGDTRILVASINYQKLQAQDLITWKKKVYSKDEVKENPLRLLFAIEDNGDIHYFGKELSTNYKFTKQDVGKYIKFYSYCNEFKALVQCIVFYVEGEHDTDVRITDVERIDSDSKESYVGEKIKLRTKFSLAEDRVSSKTREYVKWMVRVDGEEERLIIDGLVMTGREIEFAVPEDWVEKEVALMPYLYKHSEDVTFRTQIKKKKYYYEGTKKWGALQKTDNSISSILKQGRQAYIGHDKAGILGAGTIDRLKKETEEELRLLYEGKGFFNLGTRDVLRKDTANLVIENFYNGKGKKLSFDENTPISKNLTQNPTFEDYFDGYLKVIKEILENKDYDINTIDGKAIEKIFNLSHIKKTYRPNFSKLLEMYISRIREGQYEYYGLMGGTQTITVELKIEKENDSNYKIKTKMYIGDWYGSDWGDVYQGKSYDEIYSELSNSYTTLGKILSGKQIAQNAHAQVQLQKADYPKGYIPSLNAFFMLQYHCGTSCKYVPFETEIIYTSENVITIDGDK